MRVEYALRDVRRLGGFDGHQPDAGLDFSIAIRTIIKKKRRLYLPVGSGIVYDSKQTAEFRETLDKAKSFMKILQ